MSKSVFLYPALAEPRYLEEAPEERVVGGEVARPNSWPWQVKHLNNNSINKLFWCFNTSNWIWLYIVKVVKIFFLIQLKVGCCLTNNLDKDGLQGWLASAPP